MCNPEGVLISKSPKSFNYQYKMSKKLSKNPYCQSTLCITVNPVSTILQSKNCRLRGIWSRIVGVEDEHANHLTITTAPVIVWHGRLCGRFQHQRTRVQMLSSSNLMRHLFKVNCWKSENVKIPKIYGMIHFWS